MAIKGKKKSQKRGGQARRRPAAAPRQAPVARRVPWYKSPTFRVTALLGLLIIGAIVIVLVKSAQDDQAALEARQDKLDNYTGQVKAILQDVRGPATGMAGIPPTGIPPEQVDKLTKDTDGWVASLEKTQGTVAKLGVAPGTTTTTTLYTQSVQLYATASKTYALALGLPESDQTDALARAGEIRAQAGTLWAQATASLDAARAKQELGPSGIEAPDAPTSATPGALPGGQPLPGQLPPGQVPPGQLPPGGQVPPGGQLPPDLGTQPGGGGAKGGGDKAGDTSGKGSGGGGNS